jgi:aldose 1-epimerase
VVAAASLAVAVVAGCQPPAPPSSAPSGRSSASSTTAAKPPAAESSTPEKPAPEQPAPEQPAESAEKPSEQPVEPPVEKPTATPAEPTAEPAPPADKPAAEKNAPTTEKPGDTSAMKIEKSPFGKTAEGQEAALYTCVNANGLKLAMTDYGATVVSLETPDRNGKFANITLGFPNLEGYLQRHPYFGSTVGRYGNRIAGGKFSLDDKAYTLATNNGPNHLHGGKKGFDALVWKAEPVQAADGVGVKFSLRSPDGDEGYPGNLDVVVTYMLTNKDELKIDYEAKTDAPTVVNLTNHCYWNLGGAGSGKILDHELMVAADKYLPIDATSIPTGELAPVAETPLDFTKPTKIGARIEALKQPPHETKGYDHCYSLRGQEGKLELAARVKDPASGRVMEILTTEPGIQLYTGNFLDGSEGGNKYQQHDAFCLETQHYPDSPNRPAFPTTRLNPGQTLKSTTVHLFSVEK